jgi:hypothetical protein
MQKQNYKNPNAFYELLKVIGFDSQCYCLATAFAHYRVMVANLDPGGKS